MSLRNHAAIGSCGGATGGRGKLLAGATGGRGGSLTSGATGAGGRLANCSRRAYVAFKDRDMSWSMMNSRSVVNGSPSLGKTGPGGGSPALAFAG